MLKIKISLMLKYKTKKSKEIEPAVWDLCGEDFCTSADIDIHSPLTSSNHGPLGFTICLRVIKANHCWPCSEYKWAQRQHASQISCTL